MSLTVEMLSRMQFAITVGFHIIFPTLNIGLAAFLSIMEWKWLKTNDTKYLSICKFWTKIFALTFGMGVVSGIVMSYQIGLTFAGYSKEIGDVLGSLFMLEVLTAFFLEAGFLGVMLFGWNKVGKKLHYCATLLVTIGTIISAGWIMAANSWMQTPAGYTIQKTLENGKEAIKVIPQDWMKIIFNPSFFDRYMHMLFASFVTTCFVVAGVAAYYLIKKRNLKTAKPTFSLALIAALILMPIQIYFGHKVGEHDYKYQPLKTAAMEANWHQTKCAGDKTDCEGAPLVLFAWPDEKTQSNKFAIEIPKMGSWINTGSTSGFLPGIINEAKIQQRIPGIVSENSGTASHKTQLQNNHPDVPLVFFTFRIMVGAGVVMLMIALFALLLRLRGKLYDSKLLQYVCILAIPLGFVATIAGWITAEVGRQPWVVYDLIRTSSAYTKSNTDSMLYTSLGIFVVVYIVIFSFYMTYMLKTIRKGPDEIKPETDDIKDGAMISVVDPTDEHKGTE